MATDRTYRIAELSREFDVTPRTLRFYEDKGLLRPRREGQNRLYGSRDHARLALIVRGRRLGFSLDEIGELLDLYDLPDGQVSQLRRAVDKFSERIEALERQREDIDATIAELRVHRQSMERLLEEKRAESIARGKFVRTAGGYAGPLSPTEDPVS